VYSLLSPKEFDGGPVAKTIKIDFFRVVMPQDAGITFEALLNQIAAIPLDNEARTVKTQGDPVRLQELHPRAGYVEGDMVKTRMETLPEKSNVETGELAPLDLAEDEGLGEEAAFLYRPPLGCLAMQRNRFSASASAFVGYCGEVGNLQSAILLEPLISGEAIARLHEFGRINRLQVKVAGLQGGAPLRDSPYSLAHIAALADDYAGPIVNIEISMGRRQGSLARDRVNAVVDWLRGRSADGELDVRKIEVSGSAPGDETELLDLLESRIIAERRVQTNENRVVPYASRRAAVWSAWEEKRDRIQAILGRRQ
jgi:hypothetical protein